MATGQMNGVIQHLRRATILRDGAGLTDGQLLTDYITNQNEAALAALVQRHGPMVWGVCRRVLGNHQDAEDAFQATFLVFVRRSASIASRELLANWLYGVAHQTALKARATVAKRTVREKQVTVMPEPAVMERDLWNDLQPLLDQELSRLPDSYRAVIVLCDLEGKTRTEAARQLGCPEGTVASRLARARNMLAKRMARHGLAVSGGSLAAVFSGSAASAGVPTSVVSSTIHVATLRAANQALGAISGSVAVLTEGVLKTMLLKKIMATTMVVLALSIAAIIGSSLAIGQVAEKPAGNEKPMVEKKPLERPEVMDPELASARLLTAVAYSRDGKWLAATRQDAKSVTLYDTSTWKKSRTLQGMGGLSHAVVFSADSSKVFAASNDGVIYSWETKSGKPGPMLDAKAGMCYGLSLSPDGKLLASGHHDQEKVKSAICLWDPATGKQTRTIASDEFLLPNTIAFTPNGKAIAGGYHAIHKKNPDVTGFHGVIEWDVNTGKETTRYETPRITNGAWPVAHALVYTPDGKWLIIGGGEAEQNAPGRSTLYGYLWLFNRQTAKLEKTLLTDRNDYIRQLTLSADGSQLYVPANEFLPRAIELRTLVKPWSEFQCWDTKTWELMWTHSSEKPMHLTAITASPDGSRVGLAASDGFKLLDARTGKPIDGSTPAPAEKQKVLTPEEAIRMASDSKLIRAFNESKPAVEFKVEFVTKSTLVRASDKKDVAWSFGHGPDDVCLRPQLPKEKVQALFCAILTKKTISQFNKAGFPDIEKHFKGKTVRVTGAIARHEYSGYGTPPEVEIVIDDLSQLEVVK